jgi:hypothetical protein
MKYLLFVYGNYSEHEFVLKGIAKLLGTVACNDVKYQYGESGGIFHFTTLEKPAKVKRTLGDQLRGFSAMYFLVPFNKNVNFYIGDPKVETHLFTQSEETDNMSDSPKLEYNLEDVESEMSDIDMEVFMKNLSNFIGVDLTKIEVDETQQEIVKEKTLDEILDKINECGIESLTKTEKQLLDEYAKG